MRTAPHAFVFRFNLFGCPTVEYSTLSLPCSLACASSSPVYRFSEQSGMARCLQPLVSHPARGIKLAFRCVCSNLNTAHALMARTIRQAALTPSIIFFWWSKGEKQKPDFDRRRRASFAQNIVFDRFQETFQTMFLDRVLSPKKTFLGFTNRKPVKTAWKKKIWEGKPEALNVKEPHTCKF